MSTTVTDIPRGVEVDMVTTTGSWSLRFAEQPTGGVSVIVVDHALGHPVLAELIEGDRS